MSEPRTRDGLRAGFDDLNLAAGEAGAKTLVALAMARQSAVVSGHALASAAGHAVLGSGGTAIDGGIAAGLCLNVLLFDQVNYAGVAPIALFHARSGRAVTLDGLGVWPKRATHDFFMEQPGHAIPAGILRTLTPGAPAAWLTALEQFGTLTVGEVFEPAWELAAKGAPVATGVAASLATYARDLDAVAPTTVAAFFPGGRPPAAGELFARPELARVLKAQMDEEARARREGLGREESIRRALDLFYRGWIAKEICDFQRREGGLLDESDLAEHRVTIEAPLQTSYRGWEILGCGPWSQGPVLLQALNVLEQFDLEQLGHNSPAYLHLLTEAMDRAFADREQYYGDPRFVAVPIAGLLSKDYARDRAAEIDLQRAAGVMASPGPAWRYGEPGDSEGPAFDVAAYIRDLIAGPETESAEIFETLEPPKTDTNFVAAADSHGNLFAATPSDPVLLDPVVPSLGFSCSGRGSQSRVITGHPSSVAPGKRPRLTPSPGLALVDGRPVMAFGSSGGDAQPQGMLQVLLNMIDFGMNPQQAVEAARVTSWNFPNSFAPHAYFPGRLDAEGRIPRTTLEELARMGHRVGVASDWSPWASQVHAAIVNPANGVLLSASDPRDGGSAVGW